MTVNRNNALASDWGKSVKEEMSRHNLFGQPKFPAQQVHHFQNVTLLLFVTAGKLPLRRAHVYGRGGGEPHGELTAVTSILPGTNLIALQLICPRCNSHFLRSATDLLALQLILPTLQLIYPRYNAPFSRSATDMLKRAQKEKLLPCW